MATPTFCVLIPSRGRPAQLAKSLTKMPWLSAYPTYLGIEEDEAKVYEDALRKATIANTYTRVYYHNPAGSVALARERLRARAVRDGHYDYYVVTDDNAVHASEDALLALVRACHEWPKPCIMAGMHNTAAHFDRGKIGKVETVNGLRSYPSVAMIFQCYPHALYAGYRYPEEAFGLDDRHFFLWCLAMKVTEFRVCMDAPFTKARYQEGGQGSVDVRAAKTGRAIARLASDFPKFVGAQGTLRIPWQMLITAVRAGGTIHADRLAGGAMRKETELSKKLTVRVRRRT